MNLNNYTQKSLEAVQSAQNIAVQHSNQQLEQIHLLVALLQQDGGLTPQLLRKMGARQAPLSMGFPQQEYWRGLPFPPPGGNGESGANDRHLRLVLNGSSQ